MITDGVSGRFSFALSTWNIPLNTLLPCAVTSGLIPIITHAKIWRKPTAATVVVASVAKPAERSKFKHIITLNTDPFCAMPLLNHVCISGGLLSYRLFFSLIYCPLLCRSEKCAEFKGRGKKLVRCLAAWLHLLVPYSLFTGIKIACLLPPHYHGWVAQSHVNLSLGLAMRSHRENVSTANGRAIKHATMETTIARAIGMVAIVAARTTTTNTAKLVNVLTHM